MLHVTSKIEPEMKLFAHYCHTCIMNPSSESCLMIGSYCL